MSVQSSYTVMTAEEFNNEVFPLKNKIFRFAKRLMKLDVEAEDITQEVFIKLWREQKGLQAYNKIEAFAMTVTKNLCLDKLKSSRHSVKTVDFDSTDLISHGDNPQISIEKTNHKALMSRIIDQLPEQQKIIVHLREVEEYEFEEIVAITGMNINVVRINLSRARKTIKEELVKIYNYGLEIN